MIYIAILGFGTVGSGVEEVLRKNAAEISAHAGQDIAVKYILDIRDFSATPYEKLCVHDFSVIENDPDVSIVVETIGGARAAYDFTKRSLLAGKHVVTSNKELVAAHGAELLEIAKERNINYLFEASVGGGIPIIRPLTQCLTANRVLEISGILNGTTNYILTNMLKNGETFDAALRQAQQLGYAEADPTADVDGIDTCRKIAILSDLAFGREIRPDDIDTTGIRSVTLADAKYAERAGCVIKLLGRAVVRNDGKLWVYVAPHLVARECILSNVDDVFNAIRVTGDAVGDVVFYGRGAGKFPTASAVVADVIDAVKHMKTRRYLGWNGVEPGKVAALGDMESVFYVRSDCTVQEAAEVYGAVVMLSEKDDSERAFLTAVMPTAKAYAAADALRSRGIAVHSIFRKL